MKKKTKKGELTKLKLVERWSATFTLANLFYLIAHLKYLR